MSIEIQSASLERKQNPSAFFSYAVTWPKSLKVSFYLEIG